MSVWTAGLAAYRSWEHERAGELSCTARMTLVAMASFVGSGEEYKQNPVCVASQASIAERAGLSVRAVVNAQQRLEKLNIIERAGDGRWVRADSGVKPRPTVRWRLLLLSSARGTEELDQLDSPSHTASHQALLSAPRADKSGDREGMHEVQIRGMHEVQIRGYARGADNPSESFDEVEEDEGRSGAHAPEPGPSARSGLAPSNGPPSATVAMVMAERGGTAEQAEKWIERRIAASSGPVRNEVAFIRGCLKREAQTKAGGSALAKGGAGKPASGAVRGGNGRYSDKAKAAAVKRVLAGESVSHVAEELGAAPSTVNEWVSKDRWAREVAARKCTKCRAGGAQRYAGGLVLCPRCAS